MQINSSSNSESFENPIGLIATEKITHHGNSSDSKNKYLMHSHDAIRQHRIKDYIVSIDTSE